MAEQGRNRFISKQLEVKRRRERWERIWSGMMAIAFTCVLAFGIGLVCRHLLLQYSIGVVPALAEQPAETSAPPEPAPDLPLMDAQAEPETEAGPRFHADELADLELFYAAYVPGNGWNAPLRENSLCLAAAGEFVTAMNIRVQNQAEGMTGTIEYDVNVGGNGWQGWTENGDTAGYAEAGQPIEAFRVRLTGELEEHYNIYYSALQDNVWTEWVKDGAQAGMPASGKRIEGFRVTSIKKGDDGTAFPGGIDPNQKMVALTYDDGPNRSTTPKILALLAQNDAKATFFLVGERVGGLSDIVIQMNALGNELGNHTMYHTPIDQENVEANVAEYRSANEAIYKASGVTPVLVRPRAGAIGGAGLTAVGSLGMSSVLWNVDTRDWRTRDAQMTIDTVLNQVKDGDIILMHDLYDATVEASATIIPELKSRGYQLVTVSELAAYRGGMQLGRNYGSFPPAE